MWTLRLAALAGAATLLGASAAPADGPNPAGRPKAFAAGKRTMYAVWRDGAQWHLRITSQAGDKGKKGSKVTFSGSVRATGDKMEVDVKGLEKPNKSGTGDRVTVHPDGRGFDFKLVNFGATDEVVFTPGAKADTLTFRLLVDGNTTTPDKVLVGAKGAAPEKVPFTLPAHPGK